MSVQPLPNFFVVGTGKAGTTSLYHYLKQHPQVYMSPVKEPCYFASEIRPANLSKAAQGPLRRKSRELAQRLNDGKAVKPLGWLASEWEDYARLFQNVRDEKAIGEASAAYLWSETAAANIHSRLPQARIIMILRDPAERAYSQYLHQLASGLTRQAFREHLQQCIRNTDRKIGILYPFLEIGFYSQQVKRYLDLFPRDNIRILWYEEAWREPSRLLADLFQFLNVDATFSPDTSRRELARRAPRLVTAHYLLMKSGVWRPLQALVPASLRPGIRNLAFRRGSSLPLDPKDRQYLVDYYREDIEKLAALLDTDLSAWLR
jgi:Sulfotransferase family